MQSKVVNDHEMITGILFIYVQKLLSRAFPCQGPKLHDLDIGKLHVAIEKLRRLGKVVTHIVVLIANIGVSKEEKVQAPSASVNLPL